MPRPGEQLPQDIPTHMRLMLDLIVLAFQMDKTRIATCMLNNDLSQMNFGFLEGVQGSLHLDLTHNGREPEREAMYLKTNQFHVEQFAYLVGRMKAIDEGEGTLLDNSLLMFCSNLFDGDKHQADEMPILLAGRGGGSLKTGRVLDYHRPRRRQPPRVQPVSVPDGPHGRPPDAVRRCRETSGRTLRRASAAVNVPRAVVATLERVDPRLVSPPLKNPSWALEE